MSWPRMKSHRLRVRHGLLRQKNLQTCENIFKSFFFCSNTDDPAHTSHTISPHLARPHSIHIFLFNLFFFYFVSFFVVLFSDKEKLAAVHILHMQWGSNVHRMKRGPKTNGSVFIISGLRIYRPDDNNQPLQPAVSFMIFASPRIFYYIWF